MGFPGRRAGFGGVRGLTKTGGVFSMSIRLGHLAVFAKDMDTSLDFYTRVLGFERAFELAHPRTGAPWIVYVHMGGGHFIELFYGGQGTPPSGAFHHVCFVTDDIQAATRRITEAGYPLDSPPTLGADGNWQAWVTDPDGVRVELMQISPDSPQGRIGG
jgi:catechol 2,3-dioxygenase-like lactoylglutathione lyase family enzyme